MRSTPPLAGRRRWPPPVVTWRRAPSCWTTASPPTPSPSRCRPPATVSGRRCRRSSRQRSAAVTAGPAPVAAPLEPTPAGAMPSGVLDDLAPVHVLGGDHHPPLRLLPLALGADLRVLGERGVHRPALVGLHRLQPDPLPVPLGPVGGAYRHLPHRVLAPGTVALDVDHHRVRVRPALPHRGVAQHLQARQRPAAPPDHPSAVVAAEADDR